MLKVTPHAIERYRFRTSSKKSNEFIERKILKLVEEAKEIQLKSKFRVYALLNHDLKEARYFRNNNMIFVLEKDGENEYIKTIHYGEADRWTK